MHVKLNEHAHCLPQSRFFLKLLSLLLSLLISSYQLGPRWSGFWRHLDAGKFAIVVVL